MKESQSTKVKRLKPGMSGVTGKDAASEIFNKISQQLAKCKTHQDVKKIVDKSWRTLPALPQSDEEKTLIDLHLTGDRVSMPLVPAYLQQNGYCPAKIYGDGNCLPRCASVLAYGVEDHYKEMRIRIVMELVRNESKYISDNYLRKGANKETGFAKTFAMFSEHFRAEVLTSLAIKRIFQQEVLTCCKDGTYMGAWQIASLANVLNTTVESVYPAYGGATIQYDLNRKFVPFSGLQGSSSPTVYIMWSNLEGVMLPEKDYNVNHFVVLLKTHRSHSGNVEVENDVCWDPTNDDMNPILDELNYCSEEDPMLETFPEVCILSRCVFEIRALKLGMKSCLVIISTYYVTVFIINYYYNYYCVIIIIVS